MSNRELSPSYKSIPTSHMLAEINHTLNCLNIEFTMREYSTKGSRQHGAVYTLTSEQLLVNGDIVKPQIYVFNSHNGTSAFKIYVGAFRLVCSNGLVIGKNLFSERIVHRVGPTADEKLAMLQSNIKAALAYIRTSLAGDMAKTNTRLTQAQQLGIVNSLKLSMAARTQITELVLNPERLRNEDQGSTIWSLWNIVNEVLRLRSRSEYRVAQRNQNLYEDIVRLTA